jgi:serine/threonine protein kinase
MDYIEGKSLRTKLNREGVLSESLVLKYLQQLLPALETAHKQSIWHLDIKPENIMVDRYGHVYLIDFGASKHIEQNSTLTTSMALAYTKGYCPPELADLTYESDLVQALKEIGPWTDIYALGATLYNLLTDSIPPSSNRLYKVGRNAFSFPSNISSSTQDLIVWMMKPDKENRPQMIKEIQRLSSRSKRNNESTILEGNLKTGNVNTSYRRGDKTIKVNINQPNVSQISKHEGNSFLIILSVIIYLGAVLLGIPFVILLIMLFQEGDLRGEAAWPTFWGGAFFIVSAIILFIMSKAKS